MPVDSSIYFQAKLPDFAKSYYDAYDSGLTARQLSNQQQKEQNIQKAYAAGMIQNPDGSYKQDNNATIQSLLGNGLGQEAMAYQQQSTKLQAEQQKLQQQKMLDNYDMQARLLGSAKDQQTWTIAKQQAQKSGIDVSQIPDVYDEKFKNYLLGAALSAKDQIETGLKSQGVKIDQQNADSNTSKAQSEGIRASADMVRAKNEAGNKQADSYQKASHDLNTFRGNSAVQQAAQASVNVKNALSLANKGNLTPDQLHLFASELGKLATGGVPGHAEIAALVPSTIQSKLASAVSFFSNNPTDAQAQAFINNNKQYLNELADNYASVVNKYRENTIDGYKKKLSDNDIQDLKSRYLNPTSENHNDINSTTNKIFKTSEIEWK